MTAGKGAPHPESGDLLAQYRSWARQNLGGTEAQIEAAATALLRGQQQGLEKAQAIAAAKAAHRRAGPPQPAQPNLSPAPPGKIVGIARNVKPMTQLMSGFQILDFELERSDGPPVRVQVRGKMINGRVDNGDEIMVDKPMDESRFIQTDRVFNRSWNSTVEAPKDSLFDTPFTEAMRGKKVARVHRRVRIGALIYALVFVLLLISFGVFMGYQFINSNDSEHPAPAWFCEQAKKTGVENPPGC